MAEYRRCLTDFFAEGVQDGLRVAYVSPHGAEAARADLADLNDLDRLLAGGALHVVAAREVYGSGGPVDPERVVAFVAAATEQSLADGFGGLAMSTDATALVGTPVQKDAFARCEFLVDRYMAGLRCRHCVEYWEPNSRSERAVAYCDTPGTEITSQAVNKPLYRPGR